MSTLDECIRACRDNRWWDLFDAVLGRIPAVMRKLSGE